MVTLLISLSRPYDLMNYNRKRMKPKVTYLTEVQQCGLIAKLNKPNAPSKGMLGPEYEVSEGDIP